MNVAVPMNQSVYKGCCTKTFILEDQDEKDASKVNMAPLGTVPVEKRTVEKREPEKNVKGYIEEEIDEPMMKEEAVKEPEPEREPEPVTPKAKVKSNPSFPLDLGVLGIEDVATEEWLLEMVEAHEQESIIRHIKHSIPFQGSVEITHFQKCALFAGEIVESSTFIDTKDKLRPDIHTRFLHVKSLYPEEPYCQLISSEVSELIEIVDNPVEIERPSAPVSITLLKSSFNAESEDEIEKREDGISIRVPVVLGEYAIEITLQESIVFKDELKDLLEISNTVKLTECKFLPTEFTPPNEKGWKEAKKGRLFFEGEIEQSINFTDFKYKKKPSRLDEKINLNIMLELLQSQVVRASL
ncbi:hypothetical protein DFR59_11760 [Falsibacillus pallidus]|uniref:DUF7852 domain-containing protein n=2 Tax=Falsibacillus pallidus TaxID=493781 RepID=A0A370G3Q2_9BACI|nr:hypothetical protein DFR59_11760 [Falsibacillus pallidus]